MAVNINQFINITSNVADSAAKLANFGSLAIITETDVFTGWRPYTADSDGLTQLIADGFGIYTDLYRKVAAIAAASESVPLVKVFARPTGTENAQAPTLTPEITDEGHVYHFYVNEEEIEVTVQSGDLLADVCDDLVAALAAVDDVTATDNGTHVTLTPDDRTVASVFIRTTSNDLTLEDASADGGIATIMAAAVAADPAFFGFMIDGYSKAENVAAAAWAAANKRVFLGLTVDSEVADSGVSDDVQSTIAATANDWAAVGLTRDMHGQMHSALFGYWLGTDPGEAILNFNVLPGAIPDNWQPDEWATIKSKGAGAYLLTAVQGGEPYGHTAGWKAGSGRFLDITRDVAWLDSNLASGLLNLLITVKKLRNNANGRTQAHRVGAQYMRLAEVNGVIEPGWQFIVPDKSDQTQDEAASRFLDRVQYVAELSGAIEGIGVKGELRLTSQ